MSANHFFKSHMRDDKQKVCLYNSPSKQWLQFENIEIQQRNFGNLLFVNSMFDLLTLRFHSFIVAF